jgi:Kef-type K+ transport system membrane component KefB
VGGTTALLSHLTKAGLRLAINTSPEPVTNIGVSILEDVAVLALVAFAIQHPRIAAAAAGVLLAIGLVLLFLVARLVRRGWRRWKGRRQPAGAAR